MKTVAQLKRDANSGRMEVKCTIRCGQPVKATHLGERFADWRHVDKANSVDLIIEGSHSRIAKASLTEYTDDNLKFYRLENGERKLYMEYEVRFTDEPVISETETKEPELLKYQCWGDEYNVYLRVDKYYHGNGLYVGMFDPEEGPIADVTVNLNGFSHLEPNEQYIDINNSPNMGEWLEENGLAKYTGMYRISGYCVYPLYRFDMDMLKKYAM